MPLEEVGLELADGIDPVNCAEVLFVSGGRNQHKTHYSEKRGKKLPSVHLIAIHTFLI